MKDIFEKNTEESIDDEDQNEINTAADPETSKESLKFWLNFIGEDVEKAMATMMSVSGFVKDGILTEEDHKTLINKCEELLNKHKNKTKQ